MSARVVSFFRRAVSYDWSSHELAEFYRVEAALLQTGLRVSSDRGVTDEGDPWFVFCRVEDDEVIMHFARLSGLYLISAPSYNTHVTGRDFRALVKGLVQEHPLLHPPRRSSNVILHPSALLVMLVASAFLKMGQSAKAAVAQSGDKAEAKDAPSLALAGGQQHSGEQGSRLLEEQNYVGVMAIIASMPGPTVDRAFPIVFGPDSTFQKIMTLPGVPTLTVSMPDAYFLPAMTLAGTGSLTVGLSDVPVRVVSLNQIDIHPWGIESIKIAPNSSAPASLELTQPNSTPTWVQPLYAVPTETATGIGSHQSGYQIAINLLKIQLSADSITYVTDVPAEFLTALHSSVHTLTVTSDAVTTAAIDPHGSILAMPATEAAGNIDSSHTAVVTPPSTTLPSSLIDTPAVVASTALPLQAGAANGPTHTIVTGGASGAALSSLSQSPSASDLSSHAADSAASPTVSAGSDLTAVLIMMQQFAKVVGHNLAILVTGNQVIEYDATAINTTPALVHAVTFDFADGSHISLVGLQFELPYPVH